MAKDVTVKAPAGKATASAEPPKVDGGKLYPPTPYQPGDLEIRWQRATGDSRQADPQE